jgi:hypothetical protein
MFVFPQFLFQYCVLVSTATQEGLCCLSGSLVTIVGCYGIINVYSKRDNGRKNFPTVACILVTLIHLFLNVAVTFLLLPLPSSLPLPFQL